MLHFKVDLSVSFRGSFSALWRNILKVSFKYPKELILFLWKRLLLSCADTHISLVSVEIRCNMFCRTIDSNLTSFQYKM